MQLQKKINIDWIFWLIFVFGIVARLVDCFYLDNTVSRDSLFYIDLVNAMAREDFHWEQLPAYRSIPPLTFFLSLWVLKFFSVDALTAGLVVNMVCGSLLIPVAYLIGREMSADRFYRYGGAALVAISPVLSQWATVFQRESVYLLMGGCAILMILRWSREPRYRYVVGSGIFAVLSLYSRLEGFEFFLLLPLLILSIGRWHLHLGWKKVVVQVLLVGVSTVCMMGVLEFGVFRSGFLDYRRISLHLADHIEQGKE